MKKLTIILFLFLVAGYPIWAQTNSTPSSQTTAAPTAVVDKDIQILKEKIATKVAELRKNNVRGVSGVVQTNSGKKITIKSDNQNTYTINIDPVITKFYQISGTQTKDMEQADASKGSYVIVTGVINDKEVDANAVYIDEQLVVRSGKVTEVDKADFFLRVATTDKENLTIDVETYTKLQMVDIKTLASEKVGFSKIKEGDTVHIVYEVTGKEREPDRFSAQKILIIPQEYFIK